MLIFPEISEIEYPPKSYHTDVDPRLRVEVDHYHRKKGF